MDILHLAQDKIKRFKELELLLHSPEAMTDPKRAKEVGKEYRTLEKVVTAYHDYLRTSEDLKSIEQMLKTSQKDVELEALALQEKREILEKQKKIQETLKKLLLGTETLLSKNAIMEIRAGTGGLEASLFAADLYRMYTRYAASSGFKQELLTSTTTDKGGYKEIIFSIQGEGAYERFKFESGTHRVQRVPETEASGRIHTSAVTVAVLPEVEEVEVEIKSEEIRVDVFRSGGPGGQSVNTTDSAVRVTHLPTGLIVSCQDEKSQLKNKQKALKILRARLYDHYKREQESKIARDRKKQVGSGDRSEKIRTYNFPDRRVTDHRIGLTLHNLDNILEGGLNPLIQALHEKETTLQ